MELEIGATNDEAIFWNAVNNSAASEIDDKFYIRLNELLQRRKKYAIGLIKFNKNILPGLYENYRARYLAS